MRCVYPLLLAALLGGCQSTADFNMALGNPPDDAPKCAGRGMGRNSNDCKIMVRVIELDQKRCKVVFADEGQSDVAFALGSGPIWILTQLEAQPAGYRFKEGNGVAIERGRDPLNMFSGGRVVSSRDGRLQGFALHNRNRRADGYGEFPYEINVEHPDKGMSCPLDPWYRNY